MKLTSFVNLTQGRICFNTLHVASRVRDTEANSKVKVKVKQSHYRPGQALRVPGS